jgi:hypothetical protein
MSIRGTCVGPATGSASGVAIGTGAASVSTLFHDTFTDTNGTLLTAHTPDVDTESAGWTAWNKGDGDGLSLEIQDNATYNPNETYPYWSYRRHNYTDVGVADLTATFTFIPKLGQASNINMLYFRRQDTSNYWRAATLWTSANTYTLRLTEFNAGTGTTRAEETGISYTDDLSDTSVIVTTSGDSITVSWPDTAASDLTYTSSFLNTATGVGIGVDGSYLGTTSGEFNEVLVTG